MERYDQFMNPLKDKNAGGGKDAVFKQTDTISIPGATALNAAGDRIAAAIKQSVIKSQYGKLSQDA